MANSLTANRQSLAPKGQTLLELIVALGVILAGVLAGLTLIISSITAARRTQQQIVAQSLAREGLELVRSIRDSNWLDPNYPTSPDTWDRGLIDTAPDPDDPTAAPVIGVDGQSGGTSGLDYTPNAHGNNGTKVGLRGNAYVQPMLVGTDIDTHYTRLITFYRICWDDTTNAETVLDDPNALCGGGTTQVGLKVVAEVQWPGTGFNATGKVKLEERLYNWRP